MLPRATARPMGRNRKEKQLGESLTVRQKRNKRRAFGAPIHGKPEGSALTEFAIPLAPIRFQTPGVFHSAAIMPTG